MTSSVLLFLLCLALFVLSLVAVFIPTRLGFFLKKPTRISAFATYFCLSVLCLVASLVTHQPVTSPSPPVTQQPQPQAALGPEIPPVPAEKDRLAGEESLTPPAEKNTEKAKSIDPAAVSEEELDKAYWAYVDGIQKKFDQKKHKEIIALCTKVIGEAKEDVHLRAKAYLYRGDAYNIEGSRKKAAADTEKSIELDPKNYMAYWVLAGVRMHEGNLGEAERLTQKAVGLDPKNGSVGYIVMAEYVESEGKYELAAKYREKVLPYYDDPKKKEAALQKIETLRLKGHIITPATLWQAFHQNEVAAEDAYKNRRVALKGKISTITTGVFGAPEIAFAAGPYGMHQVQCDFPRDQRGVASKLRKGQTVTVSGVCRGMILQSMVSLHDCALMD